MDTNIKDFCKKPNTSRFVFVLLSRIKEGYTLAQISECLKKSMNWKRPKQSLNYHLNRLQKTGAIEKVQSHPYAIYKLTPFGDRVQRFLTPSDKQPVLFRCHNLIVGYGILSFGSFNFINTSTRKIVSMNNWNYAVERDGDFTIHIQDTGLLKIYCPEKTKTDPEKAFQEMYIQAENIAQSYLSRYNMRLGSQRIIRKGHKAIVNSDEISQVFGDNVNLKTIWTDHSTGSLELEESQDENRIENLLNLPADVKELKEHLVQQTGIMSNLTVQIERHLEVNNKIGDGLDKFAEAVIEMKDVSKQIKDYIIKTIHSSH
ncbi:MAG: hypothetical protein KJ697_03995 [Nanoarchaeota archaeon]|nr:hypothetical protein [Nanoarchaeota archaeon]